MPGSSPTGGFYYADYLKLPQLLSAQAPESVRHGRPAHDEMLFIIVHQTYELWFKQILHELDRIQVDFGGDVLEDEYFGRIVHGLDRINEVLKLLIQQLEVLETMTPLDFLDFRDFLFPASGFQSAQFRMIEITLLANKMGVPRHAFLSFMNNGVMGSMFTRYKSPALVNLDWTTTFTPELLRKDLDLGLALGREWDVPMPVTAATREVLQTHFGAATLKSDPEKYLQEDFAALLETMALASGMKLKSENKNVPTGLEN